MATSKKKQIILDLSNAKEFINNISGEHGATLIGIYLNKTKPFSDEEVAEKLKMKVTQVRTVLNSLHYRGITHYTKTKNKDSGWYSYRWTVNEKRIAELLLEKNLEKLEKLEQKIDLESDYMFFSCTKECDKLQFEIAAEYEFKCPDCGEVMNSIDNEEELKKNKEKISNLKSDIAKLEKILKK